MAELRIAAGSAQLGQAAEGCGGHEHDHCAALCRKLFALRRLL
jgi:hypothetical protein